MFKISFESESLKIIESLNVDTQLQSLSYDDLVNELRRNIVPVTELTSAERLKKIKEFPSAKLLSKLAWKVYEEGETHELPEGWKELTTASNKDIANGYYGAAFWHPENHHMVVTHRGTELNNVGAVVADIAGIVFNNCGGQMESACTFTERIVQSMKTVEQESEGIDFQLFFTGHSLGGWLAQVTSFSNFFLKRSENTFVRLTEEDPEPYHALTTAFDSPGCFPMLQKLKSRFMDGRPIHLNQLSIKTFLSAPNHINSCNQHFGSTYRIFVDSSKMNFLSRSNLGYTLTMHSIVNIADFFEKQKENDAKEVLDWPTMEGLTNTQELDKFLKIADHRNRYHIDERTLEATRKIQIRYKTRNFDIFSCDINVFTKRERHFLENLRWLRQFPEFEALRTYVKEAQLSVDIFENLTNFDIVDGRLRVRDPEKLKVFVPLVKLFVKLHPNFAETSNAILMDQKTRSKIFAYETKVCLNQFVNDLLDFDSTKLDLEKFLEKQFVHITMTTGKAQFGLSMVNKLFQKSTLKERYHDGAVLVLDLKRFSIVNELVNIKAFLDSTGGENFLLMLVADKLENSKTFEKLPLENLFEAMKLHRSFKVVICGETGDECFEDLGTEAKENLGDEFVETSIDFSWKELSQESREKLLNRSVNFQGSEVNLKSFFDLTASLEMDQHALLQLLTEKTLYINSDPLKTFDFSVYTADNDKKEIKPKILLESLEKSDDVFFISGLYDEDPEMIKNSLIKILKVEEKKFEDLIQRNLFFCRNEIDEKAGRINMISLAGSEACLKYFDQKCRDLLTKNSCRLVHWIKIKENKLTWRKTYNFNGSVKQKLLKNSRPVTEQHISSEKTAAVVGVAGQGKTCLLTQLCKELQSQSYIIHLRMNELSVEGLEQLNQESLLKFIIDAVKYDSDNHLQSFLVNYLLTADSKRPVHFLVDDFDEVLNEKARRNALKLFAFIKTHTNAKLILVTSDEKVFSELQPAIYTFEEFNRNDRENLLKQFYFPRYSLFWGSEKCSRIFADKKENFGGFAKILLDHLDQLISENAVVMGVPQQMRLIAFGFQDDFGKYIQWKQKIIEVLKVQSFYQHYINTKYELYVTATAQVASIDKKGKSFLNAVQSKTLDSLVPQSVKELLNSSELFSPDYIVLQLTKGQSPPKVLSVLTGYLLTDSKCENVRDYLNSHPKYLPKTAAFEISDETVKAITGQPMIIASLEKRAKILDFLIEILKKKADLRGVVLQKGKSNQTALEISLEKCDEACAKSLIEFLYEFGEKHALFEQLHQNDTNLMKILEKSEDRNFVEWISDLKTNNAT